MSEHPKLSRTEQEMILRALKETQAAINYMYRAQTPNPQAEAVQTVVNEASALLQSHLYPTTGDRG